jgi:hypothetical protein
MNVTRKQRMTKKDILTFFKWYFDPSNEEILKNKSYGYIQDLYSKSCGTTISYGFLVQNLKRWYKEDDYVYEFRDNLHIKHMKIDSKSS